MSRLCDSGTYMLLLHFGAERTVAVGSGQARRYIRLGPLAVYAGSAKVALSKRIARHLSPVKKVHWHIDYATAAADRVGAVPRPCHHDECGLAQALAALPGAEVVGGFGNGDCVNGCRGHLVRLPPDQEPAARALAARTAPLRLPARNRGVRREQGAR